MQKQRLKMMHINGDMKMVLRLDMTAEWQIHNKKEVCN